MPRSNAYGAAPIDHAAVANDIRQTINPNSPIDAGRAANVHSIASFYDTPMTVGEALDRVAALDQDKAIQAYERALPDKQAEMLGANPDLQAKLQAADSLRDQVFNSIERFGSPEEADYIRDARKDYGALKEVAKNLGNVQVPTPQSPLQRAGNTARSLLSLKSPYSAPGAIDTLFRTGDPNNLAASASRNLARLDLQPRQAPAVRTTPWAPPSSNAPFNPGTASPQAPPAVSPQYAIQATGTVQNPSVLTRNRVILASRANGPSSGPAGLLPGPVYPAPYSPPPAVPQVGNLPSVGFPPLAPTLWDANHPSVVVKGPSFGGDIDIDTTV